MRMAGHKLLDEQQHNLCAGLGNVRCLGLVLGLGDLKWETESCNDKL